jgi:carboxyl-terminal processing protease
MRAVFRSPRERLIFFRGAAIGVVAMSVVTMTLEVQREALRGAEKTKPAQQSVTASEEAASILKQALSLSDRVMNREIQDEDIPAVVTGALQALDPYSGYVEQEWTDRLSGEKEIVSESYMIGILGEVRDEGYVVVSTMPMSPAERVGIQSGDILAAVGEVDVREMPGVEARETLQAAAQEGDGQEMTLRFVRGDETVVINITPEHLPETFTYDFGMADGVLHIRVTSFMEGVSEDAAEVIRRHATATNLTGIIVDLRGNTGGLTSEAKKLAELVMPAGTLLYTEDGLKIDSKEVFTETDPAFPNLEIVVVIDKRSASASEIFASAVQANNLGSVLGDISYGKGTIQNVYPFLDGTGGLKITVGEYQDAKGRSINGIGVVPDELIEMTTGTSAADDPVIARARQILTSKEENLPSRGEQDG